VANQKTNLNKLRGGRGTTSPDYRQFLELQNETNDALSRRGHVMVTWISIGLYWSRGRCHACGRTVDIKLKTEPNDIQIGGNAVAENCQ
jgi:hypothetical protein